MSIKARVLALFVVHIRRKKRILLAICVPTIVWFIINQSFRQQPCSEKSTMLKLKELCREYKNNMVYGDLCSPLCESDLIKYNKCLNRDKGKLVFTAECSQFCDEYRPVTVVIKHSRYSKLEDKNNLEWFSENGDLSEQGLLNLNKKSHFTITRDELVKLAPIVASMKRDTKQYYKYALSLLFQDEYVFTKLFQGMSFVPTLYGTCGQYYAVEYTPSEHVFDPQIFKNVQWVIRKSYAIDLLNIIRELDEAFDDPLYFCDIKENNIGVSDGLFPAVKIVDSDMIFQETVFNKHSEQFHCLEDEECDIQDCHGKCNIVTYRCEPLRSNNNLQSLCENIFMDRIGNLFYGLLHDPPKAVAKEIQDLVLQCAFPSNDKAVIVRHKAPTSINRKLTSLLKMS